MVDLTERRAAEAEIQRQRETLHQSEKLAALGALLAGVAHELNNPLSVVVGYSSMLQELAQDDGLAPACGAGARRGRALRPDRQDLPRHGPLAPAAARAGAARARSPRTRSSSPATACAPPTSRSCASSTPDLPAVWGDSDQLHQVLTNLIVNAQQALLQAAPPRRLHLRLRGARAASVVIEVEDNGPGMPEEVQAAHLRAVLHHQAAGRRHRRRPVGVPGHRHRARGPDRLCAASPAQGTCFSVVLPLPADVPADAAVAIAAGGVRPARGRVLVVDDEPEIAELVAEHLRRDGLTVEVVASGSQALAAAAERGVRRRGERPAHARPGRAGAGRRPCGSSIPELARRVVLITGDALGAEFNETIRDAEPARVREAARHRRAARPGAPAAGGGMTGAGAHRRRRRRARPAAAARGLSRARTASRCAAPRPARSSTYCCARSRPTS